MTGAASTCSHKRNLRLPFMEVFDAPDTAAQLRPARAEHPRAAGAGTAERRLSQSRMAASSPSGCEREAGRRAQRQVDLAFRLALGRPPTPDEAQLALRVSPRAAR